MDMKITRHVRVPSRLIWLGKVRRQYTVCHKLFFNTEAAQIPEIPSELGFKLNKKSPPILSQNTQSSKY